MAERQSLGVVQVVGNSPLEINEALRILVDRIDGLKGLRGTVVIHERVQAPNPVAATDVVNKQSLPTTGPATATPQAVATTGVVGTSALFARSDHVHSGVSLGTAQDITGVKTFDTVATRWIDDADVLIHAYGTKT